MNQQCTKFNLLMNRQYQNINRSINEVGLQTFGINRLGCETKLEGHNKAVNTLDWSSDGKILASGSDDLNIILWIPFKKKILKKIETTHRGTIFKVMFMPKCNDMLIASSGADGSVLLHNVNQKEPIITCKCHERMVKGLASSANSPNLIWSASDDGTVNQIDLRCEHICSTWQRDRIINLRDHIGKTARFISIASNPSRSELLAVGGGDSYARIYDRRKLNPPPSYYRSLSDQCVKYYSPDFLTKPYSKFYENCWIKVIDLKFDNIGSELLVNMSNHNIFTFDVIGNKSEKMLDISKIIHKMPKPDKKPKSDCENRSCSCCIHYLTLEPKFKDLEKYFKKALDFETEGERKNSINILTDIIISYPDCANAYVRRAKLFVKRRWPSDLYCAMRDLKKAIDLNPSLGQSYILFIKCLVLLQKFKQANDVLIEFIHRNPCWIRSDEIIEMREEINLNCILKKKNFMNFRFHGEWLSHKEVMWRGDSVDYYKQYSGHVNNRYTLKEVNYFGNTCSYIVAGSHDGTFFIWERETCKLKAAYYGDSRLVHVCRTHPSINMLATGGTDREVKIWTPLESHTHENQVEDLDDLSKKNAYKVKSRLLHLALENPLLYYN